MIAMILPSGKQEIISYGVLRDIIYCLSERGGTVTKTYTNGAQRQYRIQYANGFAYSVVANADSADDDELAHAASGKD